MAKYIDLVAVRLDQRHNLIALQDPYDLLVVQAPWCSPIKDGMKVLCETSQGEELGTVEAVCPAVKVDDETIKMVKVLAKMPQDEELGKVISYFEEKTIDYDD